jgi:hypothetical protein
MKNTIKFLGIIAFVAVIGLMAVTCGDNGDPSGPTGDPALTGTVNITGTAQVGQTLTANTGSLGGSGTISYQWKRGETTGSVTSNITGAYSASYLLTEADLGKYIAVTVTREGYSSSVTSAATVAIVANTPPELTGSVTITGTAMVGQTLTAVTTALNGTGTISYQWKRGDSSSGPGTNITDATASTYTLVAADEGKYITVTVTREGNSSSVTSTVTSAVAPVPALTGTVSISGTAKVGQTLTANTDSLGGSGTISYQWRRTNTGGSTYTDITGANEDTYLLTTDDYNRLFVVVVTRADNSGNVTSTATSRVTDAMAWNQVTQSIFSSSTNISKIAYNGTNLWVAVGGSRIASSADGITWSTDDYVNFSGVTFNSVAYWDGSGEVTGRWIAVGTNGRMYTSTTGKAPWTQIDVSNIFNNGGALLPINDIIAGQGYYGRWVVIGSGRAGHSSNGTTWLSADTQPSMSTTTRIAVNNDSYVPGFAIVGGKNIATADSGTSWIGTPRDLSTIFTGSQNIQAIAYGNNLWIVAGNGGIMATAPDSYRSPSNTWTLAPGNPFGTGTIRTVTYGNNKWIAAGSNSSTYGVDSGSRIALSTDGVNWASVANTAFDGNSVNSVVFGGGKWVAVGDNGRIAYAIDN